MSSSVSTDNVGQARTIQAGLTFSTVLYGIYFYITFQSIYYLCKQRPRDARQRSFKFAYIAYSIILFVCSTIGWAMDTLVGQMVWLNHTDYPGGMATFFYAELEVDSWYDVLGSAAPMLGLFFSDALMIYRCYIVWGGRLWVIAVPIIMFVGSTVTSVIAVLQWAIFGDRPLHQVANQSDLPLAICACTLNTTVTALIISRILWFRHEIQSTLPTCVPARAYTGIVAIFIESALPFTLVGIVWAATLSQTFATQYAIYQIFRSFMGISPQLVVMRVTMGSAWTTDTNACVMQTLAIDMPNLSSSSATMTEGRPGETSRKGPLTTDQDALAHFAVESHNAV